MVQASEALAPALRAVGKISELGLETPGESGTLGNGPITQPDSRLSLANIPREQRGAKKSAEGARNRGPRGNAQSMPRKCLATQGQSRGVCRPSFLSPRRHCRSQCRTARLTQQRASSRQSSRRSASGL